MHDFINQIRQLDGLQQGLDAQLLMAPYRKDHLKKRKWIIPDNYKIAAVQILLYSQKDGFYFPLMKRTNYNGPHSGQISLPGGKYEKLDKNLEETAKRETEEELGINRKLMNSIFSLSDLFIPPSNFMVTPYLSYLDEFPDFNPDKNEVYEILEVPLNELMNNKLVKSKKIKHSSSMVLDTPYFELQNQVVWGATAMILSELKQLLFNTELYRNV